MVVENWFVTKVAIRSDMHKIPPSPLRALEKFCVSVYGDSLYYHPLPAKKFWVPPMLVIGPNFFHPAHRKKHAFLRENMWYVCMMRWGAPLPAVAPHTQDKCGGQRTGPTHVIYVTGKINDYKGVTSPS